MKSLKFCIFIISILLVIPISSVYGHGLGIEKISPVNIQGKEISISVELPTYFESSGNTQITITAIDKETKETAKNLTFLIGVFHENKLVFQDYFFTDNGILPIKIIPTSDESLMIHGEQNSLLGAWHGTESKPIEITGPIFTSSGLYHFEIEVKTIDDPTSIIENSEVYYADLSIIESAEFIQKDAEDSDVKFQTKSYFDKISIFEYNPEAKQVTFEMPVDWNEKQMSHIPVVHVEVHFPKDFEEFLTPGYAGNVNGVDLFKASVTMDDYTVEDERIVHFVLLQDHIQYIKNQLKVSDEPLPDKMTFILSTTKEIEFPLTAFTKNEEFEINLSWDPLEIKHGENTLFIFTIRDSATREPLRNSDYTFVIIQNGKEIHRVTGLAQIGGGFEKFEFSEDQTGPTVIRFENIRNTGQDTEFGMLVVPEFGVTVVLIMSVSIFAMIVYSSFNKTLMIKG